MQIATTLSVRLRMAYLVARGPRVTIKMDQELLGTWMESGDYSEWEVAPGLRELRVYVDYQSEPVLMRSLQLRDGFSYTIAVVGQPPRGNGAQPSQDDLALLAFDNLAACRRSGQVEVVLTHASAQLPTIQLAAGGRSVELNYGDSIRFSAPAGVTTTSLTVRGSSTPWIQQTLELIPDTLTIVLAYGTITDPRAPPSLLIAQDASCCV